MSTRIIPTYKCLLLGDSGIGKTALAQRLLNGDFIKVHVPTMFIKFFTLEFETNRGPVRFYVWDGKGMFGGRRYDHFVLSQCAIFMFDVTSPSSYTNISEWHRDLCCACNNISMVLCGNKVDVKDRKIPRETIDWHTKHNMKYFEISVKSNYNLENPFLCLARHLMHDKTLEFIPKPAEIPPELIIDTLYKLKIARELQSIEGKPMPEEDDDL